MNSSGAGMVRRRGDRLTSGRKFNAQELQLMLLYLLSTAPAHGYELAKRLSDMSHGYYSPSAGVLYPALGQLEPLGFAQVELKGKRKNYQITPAGREYVQSSTEGVQHLLAILQHAGKKMLWISQNEESEAAAAEATGWLPEFVQARKSFKAALLMQSQAGHDEQRRIIAVLQRARLEILQTPGTK